jgi:hypothetical protein
MATPNARSCRVGELARDERTDLGGRRASSSEEFVLRSSACPRLERGGEGAEEVLTAAQPVGEQDAEH